MKIQTAMKLSATCLEYLNYTKTSTGVDRTKTMEKLIMQDAEIKAKLDPEVAEILKKTPKDYTDEKEQKVGRVFGTKS